jgi:hypothetical protein
MKYRKKPVVIEAQRYQGNANVVELAVWMREHDVLVGWGNDWLRIPTLEGDMVATPGDWIIRGVQGEFYPCKPDVFEQTYEAVEDDE